MEVLCVAVWSCFTDQGSVLWLVSKFLQWCKERNPLPNILMGFSVRCMSLRQTSLKHLRQKICSLEDSWSPKHLQRFWWVAFWAQVPTLWFKVDPKRRCVKVKTWTHVYAAFEQSCCFWASTRTLLLCSCSDLQVSSLQSCCLHLQSLPKSLYSEAGPAPVMLKYLEIFGATLTSAICKVKSHQFRCSSFKKFWWL